MRSKSLFFIPISIILLSGGCAPKESFDLKMTIVPMPGIYAESFFNFGETGKIISMNEITGGNTEITGNFSLAEAQYLAAILSTGGNGLPLKLQIAEKQLTKSK